MGYSLSPKNTLQDRLDALTKLIKKILVLEDQDALIRSKTELESICGQMGDLIEYQRYRLLHPIAKSNEGKYFAIPVVDSDYPGDPVTCEEYARIITVGDLNEFGSFNMLVEQFNPHHQVFQRSNKNIRDHHYFIAHLNDYRVVSEQEYTLKRFEMTQVETKGKS